MAAGPGRDDKICTTPLLAVGNLFLQNRTQANLGHAGPPQNTLPLHQGRSRNNDHIIAPTVCAGLEQERYIEHNEPLPPGPRTGEELFFFGNHHRVKNALQASQGRGVGEHSLPQACPVNSAAFRSHARTHCGNQRNGGAFRCEQAMHYEIGIEHWHSEAPQHRRRGALAHAD